MESKQGIEEVAHHGSSKFTTPNKKPKPGSLQGLLGSKLNTTQCQKSPQYRMSSREEGISLDP